MKTEIIWTGFQYSSVETCSIAQTGNQVLIQSRIEGYVRNSPFTAKYEFRLNQQWKTEQFDLTIEEIGNKQHYSLHALPAGQWTLNGDLQPGFLGCIDVDLPLTPFTNSLPINRLQLKENETAVIDVIYFDILDEGIKALKQKYKKLNGAQYHYENIPNDFEADILVDKAGLVTHYPTLFTRTMTR